MTPPSFATIGPAEHPRDKQPGTLVRNRQTGIYALQVGAAIRTVPHKWAADAAAEMGKGSDAIQEQCIARMESLGLNARQVWTAMGGDDSPVSYNHVLEYLSRKSSMGSHKLQHVLPVLGLSVQPMAASSPSRSRL